MTRSSEEEAAGQHSESRIPSTGICGESAMHNQSPTVGPLPDTPEPQPPDAEEPATQIPRNSDGVLLASALVMACGMGMFLASMFVTADPGVFLMVASSIVFLAGALMFAREVWTRHADARSEHEAASDLPARPSRQARAGGIALTIVGVLILVIVVLLAVVLYFAAQFDDSGAPSDPLGTLLVVGFFVLLVVVGIAAIVVGKRQRRNPQMRDPENPGPRNSERPAVHWFWPDR